MICAGSSAIVAIGPVMAKFRTACCRTCWKVVGIRPSTDRTKATLPRHSVHIDPREVRQIMRDYDRAHRAVLRARRLNRSEKK